MGISWIDQEKGYRTDETYGVEYYAVFGHKFLPC
jgi:hypothetical protein